MKEQKIIWTVLPNGRCITESGAPGLKFSVFISPRLYTNEGLPRPHLDMFPDFLNWPEKVSNMTFDIEFNNGAVVREIPDQSNFDSDLWRALFKGETFVRPYEFKDFKDRAIRTFPVQDIMQYIKKKYVSIAEKSPGSLPFIAPRRKDDGTILDDPDSTLESLIDELGGLLDNEKKIICTISREYLGYLINGRLNEFLASLPKSKECPEYYKLTLNFGEASISKAGDNLWKISDGEYDYYIEDTGEALNLFQYISNYSKIDGALKTSKVLDPAKLYGYKKEELDFLQAARFYDRQEISNPYLFRPNAKMAPLMPEMPEIDFHQMLSTLGDHPMLMRKLALVIDFIVPAPEEPFNAMRIKPAWNAQDPPSGFHIDQLNPWTKCIFNNKTFLAMPKKGSKLKDRMLNLRGANDEHAGGNTNYHLVQIDPDGASLQMIDSSSSIRRQMKRKYIYTLPEDDSNNIIRDCKLVLYKFKRIINGKKGIDPDLLISDKASISQIASNKWTISDKGKAFELEYTGGKTIHIFEKKNVAYDTPDNAGLPSLRSAGIALTESRRAFRLNKHFINASVKNQDLDSSSPVTLYADDLVRGYKIDILDEGTDDPEWLSLCRRVGKYSFPETNAPGITVDDEGYVKRGSTSSADAKKSDLYLHETVFRWDGWSLCAQRPGRTMVSEPYKDEVFLFCWDNVPSDNDKLLAFLEDYLNARWVRDAKIEKPDAHKITITDLENSFTLTADGDGSVKLITDDLKEYEYISKKENGRLNVYTVIDRQDENPGIVKNEAATEFKLESDFAAKPGSLPKLRFGHTYRLRARIADLAGNSESWETPDRSLSTESIHYVRYEPLLPPTLVPRTHFTEGESAERMVIRSNYDMTASHYAGLEEVHNALQNSEYIYLEGNERHVVPPKTSQLMAETHGEFDPYIGTGKDYKTGYNIALKEEGTLYDDEIVNINTGEKDLKVVPAPIPVKKDEESENQYVIHSEEQLMLPYLPDPICQGVALHNPPGLLSNATNDLEKIIYPVLGLNLLKVPFDLDWPDGKPFRIRIAERPGHMKEDSCEESFDNSEDPPKWDPDHRVLTLFLGKAQQARVLYSCYFGKEDLSKMGIWKWLGNSSIMHHLEKYALSGKHWMLTPYRELVMVHAVQQPLCEPKIPFLLSMKKEIGDTFTRIAAEINLNAQSTGKLNLLAQWTEPIDDLAVDEPGTIDVNASAFELKIDEPDINIIHLPVRPCVDHRHEFGDTKYRHVKYYMLGTTRFREYFFHPDLTEDFKSCFDWSKIPGEDDVKLLDFLNRRRKMAYTSAATIAKSTDGQIIEVEEAGMSISLELNKGKNAIIVGENGKTYIYPVMPEGDSELCIHTDKITRRGPVYETDVMNSARPASPKVKYILPTFGWEEKNPPLITGKWKTFERKRVGGGLRVYLERPWFSSGDGELLGVVLYPHEAQDELKPYITQWGMDPIRKSKVPKGILTIQDFTGAEKSQGNLSLEELEEKGNAQYKFNVVGFKPEYNKDRKLWYCDIQFDPEKVISYYPFVRLALTRYQPNSIPNAHLSRVVLTDFVQLANDRTLNIKFMDERVFNISLTGYGTGNRSSNRVEVTVEELPAGAHEEFGWIPIPGSKTQPNPCTLPLHPVDTANYLWRWEASMKLPTLRRAKKYRLSVREFEKYIADKEVKVRYWKYLRQLGYADQEVERLVYADVIEL